MREVAVQVIMTVEVEDEEQAINVAQRWLPYARELPLGCSDGSRLVKVELSRNNSSERV